MERHYVMPNLPTGPYRLEASLQGFRTYAQTGIVLQVGGTPTINVALALGSLEETVTVEAAAPLVDVQSAGISEVVENERILELPLQGRQVTDLIVLAGAAVQTGAPSSRSFPGGVTISVAGGLPFGVGYLLDGAMHNNPQNNLNLPLPFPDALQEFSVATGGLSAQNGMHSAASVNAVTKSGTNAFSRQRVRVPARQAVQRDQPVCRDRSRRQAPGRRAAAQPVRRHARRADCARQAVLLRRLSGHGAARQRRPTNIACVPTAAMLAGDFTAFASPACNGGRQIALRAPFVNNRDQPGALQPRRAEARRRLPTTTDPCGEITFRPATTATRARRRPHRLPVERQPLALRPVHGDVHQADAAPTRARATMC